MSQGRNRAFFVTATGTDIGKTYVSAALLRHWRAAGRHVAALKPVLSGFDQASAQASDAGALLQALGQPVDSAHLDRVAPWRFAAPLSPDMAAAREGKRIDLSAVTDFCRAGVAGDHETILIEGVGGVMVPLSPSATVLDWMEALALPIILVTGSYLGTLSHTLTALTTLAARQLSVAAVVLNESPENPVPLAETAITLKQHWPGLVLAGLSRPATTAEVAHLADLLDGAAD